MMLRSKLLILFLMGVVVLTISVLCLMMRWSSPYTSIHTNMIIDTLGLRTLSVETAPHKPVIILLYHKLNERPNWWFKMNETDFSHCPHHCQVINDKARIKDADMIMFEAPRSIKKQENGTIYLQYFLDWGAWPDERGNSDQVRMFYSREPQSSGLSGDKLSFARYMFNYTISFLKDADTVYSYGFVLKHLQPKSGKLPDYGKEKSRHILWAVSNCRPKKRIEYAEELNKYIQVDMIGGCNKAHGDPCKREPKCTTRMRRKYKFYLAFENSLCQEYITEKFWRAFREGMVPIAMGAARKVYDRVAPPHSFIHVDDFVSPQKLAEYLRILITNNTLYNNYHSWRYTQFIRYGKPENCEICRLATEKPHKITDITRAWNGENQCVWP